MGGGARVGAGNLKRVFINITGTELCGGWDGQPQLGGRNYSFGVFFFFEWCNMNCECPGKGKLYFRTA
jgi:hypothetical protein